MKVEKIINAPVSSNSYLLTEGTGAIIIDPGTIGSKELIDTICSRNLLLEYIFLTHEHFDHCAGTNALRSFSSAPLWCSNECSNLIQDERSNYSAYWLEGEAFQIQAADHCVKHKEELMWHGHTIYFYITHGHSNGSITIRIDNVALFTGDNYVPDIRTYTNLKGGNKDNLRHTLAFYSFFSRYEQMKVYPGHLHSLSIKQAHFYQSLRGCSEKQIQEEVRTIEI
jgi:glyoxylase-like metal-dependent hydrolase (beta-lactamase superfamily II)